jgi:type VI secretion system protein ImpL
MTQADLDQFQRAAKIATLYFSSGSLGVRIDIKPFSADAAAKQASLEFDDKKLVIAAGAPPQAATTITWPGSPPMQTARLSFDPPPSGAVPEFKETGPWGLFRLVARGTLKPDPAVLGGYTLSFKLNEREAVFDIRAGTTPAQNPFDMSLLRDFRCPAVQ